MAVVVPDEPNVKFWADSKGIPSQSLSALCNNKELKVNSQLISKNKFPSLNETFIMEELSNLGHIQQLSAYEKVQLITLLRFNRIKKIPQVASVYLHPDLFSVENGLRTHSGLLKRRTLETYFRPQIEMMYSKIQ